MSACWKGEQWQGTDVISYSAAMSACEKGEQCQQALGLLAVMQKADQCMREGPQGRAGLGVSAETQTYLSFSEAVCLVAAATAEEAQAVAAWWSSMDLEPNMITDTTLISACENDHQVEKAIELGGEMQQRVLEPNGITGTALISACEKGQVEKAIELHSDLAI